MAQLTDETQTLRGMLELGASSSDNPGSSSSDTQGSSSRGDEEDSYEFQLQEQECAKLMGTQEEHVAPATKDDKTLCVNDSTVHETWGSIRTSFWDRLAPHFPQPLRDRMLQRPMLSQDFVQRFVENFEVEDIAAGFALCDQAGAILWCNRHLATAIGYKDQEAYGCTWQSLLYGPASDA